VGDVDFLIQMQRKYKPMYQCIKGGDTPLNNKLLVFNFNAFIPLHFLLGRDGS